MCLFSIFSEWNGPQGIKRMRWRDQAIKYVHKGSQMKAAQELLIFPFPNFFTFFIMWYLKEKKLHLLLSLKNKSRQTTEKKKKIHDMTQALLSPVGLGTF